MTVTGTGASGNPYVVSATGGQVTVSDTTTVDMTASGTDPTDISAVVRISGAAGNILTAQADGLAVLCEAVQDCVGMGFTGGLIYDDAANAFRVQLSADAGNTLVLGGDGGLYNPSSAGAGVVVADTPTVDMTAVGAAPTTITADVKISPTAPGNLLTAQADGLAISCESIQDCVGAGFAQGLFYDDAANQYRARLSADAGNAMSFGADGGLYTAASALVVGACGLAGTGTLADPLRANVAAWPFPCDQSANAQGVFCDPATGQLQAPPRGAVAFDQEFITLNVPATAVPAGPAAGTTIAALNLTVNNPSSCLPAIAMLELEDDADFQLPNGGAAELMIDADVMWRDQNNAAGTTTPHGQGSKVVSAGLAVAAGGSNTITNELRMRGGAGGATYTRAQLTGRMWLFAL